MSDEHQHVWHPVISRNPMGFEYITGHRCDCGATTSWLGARPTKLSDPVASAQAAARYIQKRYGTPHAAFHSFERDVVAGLEDKLMPPSRWRRMRERVAHWIAPWL